MKKVLVRIVGRKAIDWMKHIRDSYYSKPWPSKKVIGNEDQWTIVTSNLFNPIVYSGGVGKNFSFERELVDLFQAEVFMFDPSETGIRTIQKYPPNPKLHFSPIALAGEDGYIKLYSPVNPEEGSFTIDHRDSQQVSVTFPCRKLDTLMKRQGHSRIDILKIDIEGSEYDVLNNALDEKITIDQICVEFHHGFMNIPWEQTARVIKRLKTAGYVLFHKSECDYSFCHKRIIPKS